MTPAADMLDRIQIASPCPMRWDQMDGDARQRYCSQCHKSVYDLSQISRPEALALLERGMAAGELPCVQLFRRADGTVITSDCSVGLRSWGQRLGLRAAALIVACLSLVGCETTRWIIRGGATVGEPCLVDDAQPQEKKPQWGSVDPLDR